MRRFPARLSEGVLFVAALAAAAGCSSLAFADEPSAGRSAALLCGGRPVLDFLDQRIEVQFQDHSLAQAAETLSRKSGLPIHLHTAALEKEGKADLRITGQFASAPLRDLLAEVLPGVGLTYVVEPRSSSVALKITTHKAADSPLHTAVYSASALLSADGVAYGLEADGDSLLEAIAFAVASNSWSSAGGMGELSLLGDLLVVRHTWETLEEVARFLSLLERARQLASSHSEQPLVASFGDDHAESAKVWAALGRVMEIDLAPAPLSAAVQALAEKAGLPIVIDGQSLKEAGLTRNMRATLPLSRATLESLLFHLLAPLDLTWKIDGDSIVVTTFKGAEEGHTTRLYPVADLAFADDPLGLIGPDFDTLIELVTMSAAPESWPENGRDAECILGAMVIRQTATVHRRIDRLLTAWRRARAARAENGEASLAAVFAEGADDAEVRARLAAATDIRLNATSLSEAVRRLSEKCGAAVLLDTRRLEQEDRPLDAAITLVADNEPLGDALARALAPLELTYVIEHGAAWVTTIRRAEGSLVTAVYPIDDLAPSSEENWSGDGPEDDFANELLAFLQTVPDRGDWLDGGGPGDAQAVFGPPALVVSQTEPAHAQVAAMLKNLRIAKGAEVQPATAVEETELVQHVFRLKLGADGRPLIPAGEAAALVRTLIEPQSWSDGQTRLEGAAIALVVRHKPAVLRQVRRLLEEIGALQIWPIGWGHLPYVPEGFGPAPVGNP